MPMGIGRVLASVRAIVLLYADVVLVRCSVRAIAGVESKKATEVWGSPKAPGRGLWRLGDLPGSGPRLLGVGGCENIVRVMQYV